jgi:hypothetical protein
MDLLSHLWELSGCASLEHVSFSAILGFLESTGYKTQAFEIFTTWLKLQAPDVIAANRAHIVAVHTEYLKRRLHDWKQTSFGQVGRNLLQTFFADVQANPLGLYSPEVVAAANRFLSVGAS